MSTKAGIIWQLLEFGGHHITRREMSAAHKCWNRKNGLPIGHIHSDDKTQNQI